ncbi:MAG: hypothetical protein COV31_02590 [Candidatus Yanofskybacteria bacterium CG10_big_fil_rev_8_21_14_0_10_46_23]|uniref:SHS2 domain-containing protein n=1 Tax=Candidatus Yanofskybacteria bacterium CG10_big_fil_rev_8_21_14_0_10_46_23 TaxID=1975098 RepID=A0A2H0R426_9BACT|nr:MAG: hypothetical protein COV31_02590 [Candidatus Yanofskybacteria bacterium CG10_big_fil_rev_8_21_14_0_10_46_23]
MGFFGIGGASSRVGIDIGTASIKIIELEKKGGRFNLKNYGLFELEGTQGAIQAKQKIRKLGDEDIIWGIQQTMKESGIKAKDVIASIPLYSTFATIITLPYLSKEDIAKAIPFEARKYVPLPLDKVNLDWSIVDVGRSVGAQGPPPEVDVFLAAVSKNETSRYQTIMKGAKLNLRALELENMSLIRALVGNDRSPLAIVNIGGRSTSISVIDKGFERLSRNYEFGGFEITKSIANSLNVSYDRAEELKKTMGLKDSGAKVVNEAMLSLIDMMVFETRKTISSYESEKKLTVPKILLVGGLSNMPGFADYFRKKIGITVEVGNPFSRVVTPKELGPITQELGTIFAVATGLAMREI